MRAAERLQTDLALGEEARTLVNEVADEVTRQREAAALPLSFRERVLAGLAWKMYDSFECLISDAREQRSGAMHHLKTMVETFIYFHWAARDASDIRTKLVYAKGADRKVVFYRKNPEYAGEGRLERWGEGLRVVTQGLEEEWRIFKTCHLEGIAKDAGDVIAQWYRRIYAMACEPAHIADLVDYMPLPEGPIRAESAPMPFLQASIAIDYGLHIMWSVLRNASEFYRLGLGGRIDALEARHNAVRMLAEMD